MFMALPMADSLIAGIMRWVCHPSQGDDFALFAGPAVPRPSGKNGNAIFVGIEIL